MFADFSSIPSSWDLFFHFKLRFTLSLGMELRDLVHTGQAFYHGTTYPPPKTKIGAYLPPVLKITWDIYCQWATGQPDWFVFSFISWGLLLPGLWCNLWAKRSCLSVLSSWDCSSVDCSLLSAMLFEICRHVIEVFVCTAVHCRRFPVNSLMGSWPMENLAILRRRSPWVLGPRCCLQRVSCKGGS